MTEKTVSYWRPVPGDDHCYMRILLGTDENLIENRVAFIEKTPRVRIGAFTDRDSDWKNWEQGSKGCGPDYGEDPVSREWCDTRLRELGYIVPESSLVKENIMTRKGYTPYCGSDACLSFDRTRFNGEQFYCHCGWKSQLSYDFISRYKEKWQIKPK